jgi:hypothetical protein
MKPMSRQYEQQQRDLLIEAEKAAWTRRLPAEAQAELRGLLKQLLVELTAGAGAEGSGNE